MPTKKKVSIMNSERTLLSSILFLALGLGLIVGYCHGSTIGLGSIPASCDQHHGVARDGGSCIDSDRDLAADHCHDAGDRGAGPLAR